MDSRLSFLGLVLALVMLGCNDASTLPIESSVISRTEVTVTPESNAIGKYLIDHSRILPRQSERNNRVIKSYELLIAEMKKPSVEDPSKTQIQLVKPRAKTKEQILAGVDPYRMSNEEIINTIRNAGQPYIPTGLRQAVEIFINDIGVNNLEIESDLRWLDAIIPPQKALNYHTALIAYLEKTEIRWKQTVIVYEQFLVDGEINMESSEKEGRLILEQEVAELRWRLAHNEFQALLP